LDPATIEVYERVAGEYTARRRPRRKHDAIAFGAGIAAGEWRADLGSGSGRYTPYLGTPVLALDAAAAMLALARGGTRNEARGGTRVRGDLEHPPLRRGALAGAWASVSYHHVPRERLPLALARLHDALQVDAPLWMSLPTPPGDGDFPGRLFERWGADEIATVLAGAGFGVQETRLDGEDLIVTATRLRTLPDIVGPGMRVLVCGLNPSVYAADRGVGFARPGNRFWPAALAAGLVSRDRDPWHALASHGIGFTDLVKRATPRADVLTADEYRAGVARLTWLVGLLRPAVVCVVGLAGWRMAVDRRTTPGLQRDELAGVPVYVMPNPSGLNAHTTVADLAAHLEAARLTGSRR
jgi:double-stranded uracil-DNA glycosylase